MQNRNIKELGFHPNWVAPFHPQFMGFNFVNDPNREVWLTRLKETLPQFTDQLLIQMLEASNWRPRKVAPWIIAIENRQNFRQRLEEELDSSPFYSEHIIAALYLFGDRRAHETIEQYLKKYLGQLSTQRNPDFLRHETLSLRPAMAALCLLDTELNLSAAPFFIEEDGLWWNQEKIADAESKLMQNETSRRILSRLGGRLIQYEHYTALLGEAKRLLKFQN